MTQQTPTAASDRDRPTAQSTDLLSARALFRLGLLLVLAAIAFFLRYSFEQGWIGPTARVGLAAAVGLAMIVTGIQISTHRPAYGNILQGGGGGVLYLTAFAAHQRYGLTAASGAFVLLFAISAAVVAMAVRQRSEPLAVAGIAGALIAPIAVGGRLGAFPGDAGYLIAVLGVAAALYLAHQWAWLFSGAVAGVSIVLSIDILGLWLGSNAVSPLETQVGISALWAIGWGGAMAAGLRRPRDVTSATIVPIAVTATLPLFTCIGTLVIWDIDLGDFAWMAISLGFATVHMIAFFALRSTKLASLTAPAQLVPAATLAIIAWIGGLEGALLLATVMAQAALMIVVGIRARVELLANTGHVIAGIVAAAWVIVTFGTADTSFNSTDVYTGLVVLIAAAVGFIIHKEEEPHATLAQVYAALSLPAALIWPAATLTQVPNGAGLITAVWAVIGFALLTGGRVTDNGLIRNFGIGVVLLAVAKLLFIDTSAATPLVRMALFAGIGLALLGTGYWLGSNDDEMGGHTTEEPVK